MLRNILIIVSIFLSLSIYGQEISNKYRLVFYNVENFFDTKNDKVKLDDEFTYKGKKRWSKSKYINKTKNIANVISSLGKNDLPTFIGLAEIENSNVIDDLINKTQIREGNYKYVHYESPDIRGIDVALLYRKDLAKLKVKDRIRIYANGKIRTRDIIYSKFLIKNTDAYLHIFVCHLPSMFGGKKKTDWKREFVLSYIKNRVDSIFNVEEQASIIVMGDMNTTPDSKVIRNIVHRRGDLTPKRLYNSYIPSRNKQIGTYKYKRNWSVLDQIFISSSMIDKSVSNFKIAGEMKIYSPNFLIEPDKKYFGYKPKRTYIGHRYNKGFSDHLPVYLDIILNKK